MRVALRAEKLPTHSQILKAASSSLTSSARPLKGARISPGTESAKVRIIASKLFLRHSIFRKREARKPMRLMLILLAADVARAADIESKVEHG
jgi:hypothetical protein